MNRGGYTILPSLIPEDVFDLTTQFKDGKDYHQYIKKESGKVIDISRPEGMYKHSLDIVSYISEWAKLPVIEYIQDLPDSVQWNPWQWDTFSLRPGGYTPIEVILIVRSYNREGYYAKRWWFSASYVPDRPELAAGQVVNRVDHTNYVLVDANKLKELIELKI